MMREIKRDALPGIQVFLFLIGIELASAACWQEP